MRRAFTIILHLSPQNASSSNCKNVFFRQNRRCFLQWGWWSSVTCYPRGWWIPCPWVPSWSSWTGLWATWSNRRYPWPWQKDWSWCLLKVSSNTNQSMILWKLFLDIPLKWCEVLNYTYWFIKWRLSFISFIVSHVWFSFLNFHFPFIRAGGIFVVTASARYQCALIEKQQGI